MNKFNLSLDDMSPHPRAGLNFESIKWCDKIIEKYSSFKVNLFVPAAYCRLGEKPCYLSEYPEWIKIANNLSANYRINLHGFNHRRTDKRFPASNNDEFQYLNEKETNTLIKKIEDEFSKAGLKYHKTFRPPGWKISKVASETLVKRGYRVAGKAEVNWDLLAAPPSGNVIAYGHTSNWTTNYLNEERYNTIMNFLNDKEFEFCFIEDM